MVNRHNNFLVNKVRDFANFVKQLPMVNSRNMLAFLIYLSVGLIYFIPAFFFGKSLFIETIDQIITYVRMIDRANWLTEFIVPLWDPKSFSGLSFIDSVPTTHLLNLQSWIMAIFGNQVGYNLCVLVFVIFGAYGTYLLCHKKTTY